MCVCILFLIWTCYKNRPENTCTLSLVTVKYLPLPMTVSVSFGGTCAEGPVTSAFSSAQGSLASTDVSKHLCTCYEAAPPCTERSVAKMKHENGDLFVSEALPVCDTQASWSFLQL